MSAPPIPVRSLPAEQWNKNPPEVLSKRSKISLDSHTHKAINFGDEINIAKADKSFTLIHPQDHDFFNACRTKLGWSLEVHSEE